MRNYQIKILILLKLSSKISAVCNQIFAKTDNFENDCAK